MGTVLKVGEQEVSTYRNMVQYPVPYSSGQVTASYYTGNPNPGTTISYLLDQVDGATTAVYEQYLEDYARYTTPLLGAGTDPDPYYFYPYPLLVRKRVDLVAADFVNRPYLNTMHYFRVYAGVTVRMTCFWYNSSNAQIYSQTSTSSMIDSSAWQRMLANFAAPPQAILDNVAYVYYGIEVMSGMGPAQNYFDVTGFRATPTGVKNFDDHQGTYWDGSTAFTLPAYVPTWAGTPRASLSTLTITQLAAITEETENALNFSVAEDVTGLDVSALSGGTSQATITIPYREDTTDYLGLTAELQDYQLGNFYGRVRDLGETPEAGQSDIQIDESLSLLNAWVTAPPMSGTLSSVLRNYVTLAEAPVRGFTFEDGTDTIAVNVPGFVNNLYDKIRELLAAYSVELVTIDGTHVVRSILRDSVALDNYTEPPTVRRNLQETAQYVRVHWYDNEYVTNGQVFPVAANPQEDAADIPEPTIYSIGANEVLTVDIQLRASLLSVNVPVYVSSVPDEDVTGGGIYTAVGSDSLPITPAQWAAGGGSLDVAISPDDPSVIKVTMKGPDFPALAPFRLAMSSGSGNYYNALHITGTGVFVRDQYVDLATGALPSATGQRYAVEVTNPFISTKTQAYNAGQIVAGRQAQAQTINYSVPTPEQDPAAPVAVLGVLPGAKFVYANQQFRIDSSDVNHHTASGSGTFGLPVEDFDHFLTRLPTALVTGVAPGRASTPSVADLVITGDMDVRANVMLDDWTPTGTQIICGKTLAAGGKISWRFGVISTGMLRFTWTTGGVTAINADSTVAPTVANGAYLWVRANMDVDNGASGRSVRFYTSTNGYTWTQLGTTVTVAGVTSIFGGDADITVSGLDNGAANQLQGKVSSIEIRNSAGVLVANPQFGAQPIGTTSFTDAYGKVWTINSPASIQEVPAGLFPGALSNAQFDALYAGQKVNTLNFSLKPLLHRFAEV